MTGSIAAPQPPLAEGECPIPPISDPAFLWRLVQQKDAANDALRENLAQMTRERDAAVAACAYARRSILRFPGSVHDAAVAKIDKALGYSDSVFVDAQEARIVEVTTARDAAVAERDEAREVVAKVNNSFGSYAYFTKPHPADQVEELKEQCRKEWLRANAAVAREARLREDVQQAARGSRADFRRAISRALAATSEPEGGA